MSQILLFKLKETPWSYSQALTACRHCRLDPSTSQHGAVVDEQGILHYFHINISSRQTTELLAFQLHFRASQNHSLEPLSKPWTFEFVPGLPGEILLVQPCSTRILYASLPRRDSEASDVFLFGSHTATVNCIVTNGNIALSGCKAGVLKLWRMADGQMADSVPLYEGSTAGVTAISCIGPLLVAAGSAAGAITLYDIASGRLLAVQRLEAGQGPISCLSSWIHNDTHAAATVAPMGPRVPDGGGVLPGTDVGMPWRLGQQQEGTTGDDSQPASVMIAASSPTGWLRIYAASSHSTQSWQLLHSSHGLIAAPITALAFTPCGRSVVVASPAEQIVGMDAIAVAAAGGQPGAVSVYRISGRVGLQQELQLWQQWCLKSLPMGLIVLPSSQVQFMAGKRFEPAQALHVLVTPELGPSLVLTTSQPLEALHDKEQPKLWNSATANTKRQPPGMFGGDDVTSEGLQQQQQQQQQQQLPVGATELATNFHRLDIVERDLAAVADAIAGASSLEENDLMAMLKKLVADTGDLVSASALDADQEQMQHDTAQSGADVHQQAAQRDIFQYHQQHGHAEHLAGMSQISGAKKQLFSNSSATAAVEPQQDPLFRASLQASSLLDQGPAVVDRGPSTLEQGPVAAELEEDSYTGLQQSEGTHYAAQQPESAAADTADADMLAKLVGAGVTHSASAGLGDILRAATAAGGRHHTGTSLGIQGASGAVTAAAVAGTSRAAEGATDADVLFTRPSTLPTLRSWMNREAVLAAGTAAEGPAAAIDIKAIADEMRQQQERLKRQQELQQQVSAAEEEAAKQSQSAQQQQPEPEDELPCESTFQGVLLQQQQLQQEQQLTVAVAEKQAQLTPATVELEQELQVDMEDGTVHDTPRPHGTVYGLSQETIANPSRAVPASGPQAEIGCSSSANTSATAALHSEQPDELEPQPRCLPAMLQRPQSTGPKTTLADQWKQQQQPLQRQWQQPAAVDTSAPVPCISAEVLRRPTAAVVSAAIQVTSAAEPAATADAISNKPQQAQQDAKNSRQPVIQQQLHHELDQQQPRPAKHVRERLHSRLRQQQQRQQQQQQGQHGSGTAGTGAPIPDVVLPVNDHPLATAMANSSRLLAQRIQEGEKVPEVSVDPADVMKLAVQLTDLDVDFDTQQYQDLPDLKDIPTPTKATKLVPKQLDPRWVASRNLKPQMDTLFKPSDWQAGVVQPQVLVLPQWPTPQQVVQSLLFP